MTKVIDALDESNSEVIRFDGTSKVMHIGRYTFFREKLLDALIFKIPQFPASHVFVTDPFVDRVESTKLKGFWFPRVWSAVETAIIEPIS